MRSSVELPDRVHQRVRELAIQRGQSLSSMLAELTVRGLAQMDEDTEIQVDQRSGFPVISIGRPVTSRDVAEMLDDE